MYGDFIQSFHGRKVVDFNSAKDWVGADVTYRLRETDADATSIGDRLAALLARPGAKELQTLIIGAWSGVIEGDSSEKVVAKLVEMSPHLPNLKALFLGEIINDECELSWITQSDVSSLLIAFPNLLALLIRGGWGLTFSRVRHDSLMALGIESGGLGAKTLSGLFRCELPALEFLELHLGDEDYGFDGSIDDLEPLLSGHLYPRLTHLGLVNSAIANDIAEAIVTAPIVDRISELDLSLGNLDDTGLRSLHGLADKANLIKLDISHHYCSEAEIKELRAQLPCELIAEDAQQSEDDSRSILHSE